MKDMHAAVNAIKNDKVHGAGYLTDKALEAVKDTVASSQADNSEDLWQELSELASGLMACRPTMVSISNCTHRFVSDLQNYYASNPDLNSLRDFSLKTVQNIRNEFLLARSRTVQAGAGLVAAHDKIITCSYSATVVEALTCAHSQGKPFLVLAVRSQASPKGIAYGDKMASELGKREMECKVIADADIYAMARQADRALIGADAILADGSILNGFPSAKLAHAAEQAGIPFYTICESSKFLNRDMPDEIETGFNLVPSSLITRIVSDKDIFKPVPPPRLF